MQGEFYPSSSLHTIRISQDLYSSEAGENKSRPDALKWICGSGDGWEDTVCTRGHVVEGRTCPPDPFNDMSSSIGRGLQGVGRCKSPAPADIRVAP